MNAVAFRKEIRDYYHGQYPLVCVETFDERETLAELIKFQEETVQVRDAKRKLEKVMLWSPALGYSSKLVIPKDEKNGIPEQIEIEERSPESSQPNFALQGLYYYTKSRQSTPTLFILRDLGDELRINPIVQRWLREIFMQARKTRHMIVLTQPTFEIPTILEKELVLMDGVTPDIARHRAYFNKFISKQGADVTNALDESQLESYFANLSGLTAAQTEHLLPTIVSRFEGKIDDRALDFLNKVKQAEIRKGRLLDYVEANESLDDIGGMGDLKDYINDCSDALTPDAQKFGITPPRGFLCVGPSGTGKTMVAKATSIALGLPLIRWNIGAMFSGVVGSTEARVRQTLKQLEQYAPCVVWIDEIEKLLAGGDENSMSTDSGVTKRVVGEILTFMNDTKASIFFVATSNSLRGLPPELTRKGRFDETFFIDLPSRQERRDIFRKKLRAINRNPKNFDIKALGRSSVNYTGAEIQVIIQAALRRAFKDGEEELTTDHILAALTDTKPLAQRQAAQVKKLREWADENCRLASTQMKEEIKESERKTRKNILDDDVLEGSRGKAKDADEDETVDEEDE